MQPKWLDFSTVGTIIGLYFLPARLALVARGGLSNSCNPAVRPDLMPTGLFLSEGGPHAC